MKKSLTFVQNGYLKSFFNTLLNMTLYIKYLNIYKRANAK